MQCELLLHYGSASVLWRSCCCAEHRYSQDIASVDRDTYPPDTYVRPSACNDAFTIDAFVRTLRSKRRRHHVNKFVDSSWNYLIRALIKSIVQATASQPDGHSRWRIAACTPACHVSVSLCMSLSLCVCVCVCVGCSWVESAMSNKAELALALTSSFTH